MRIRGTKPEFYSSELIARIPWEYRFLLKGLESYVDDNGVGKDDLALIVGAICPRDMFANPRETVARVSEGVSVIHQAGMLWRYEADGLKLLYVSFFDSAQRIDKPNKGRYRRPDGTMEYRESVIGECFVEPSRGFATTSDTLAPVTEEQGNRGTEENPPTPQAKTETPARITNNDGRAKALARIEKLNGCATSPASWDITRQFTGQNTTPMEEQSKIAAAVHRCLSDGIPAEQITAGLNLWAQSDSWATSQIGTFVAKAARKRKPNGADAKGGEWINLAAQLDTALEA